MKKQYYPPEMERVFLRLTPDILKSSIESTLPVEVNTTPAEEPSELDDWLED